MIDVVVVAQQSLFVDLLTSFLRSRGLEVAVAAPTPQDCSSTVANSRHAVCLVDGRDIDRRTSTTLVTAAAGAGREAPRVVLLSRDCDIESIENASSAGAMGYVHPSTGIMNLVRALDRVRAGHRVACTPPPAARCDRHDTNEVHRLAAALTARERECLSLLVDGLGTTEMATRLSISDLTVRSHVQAVLYKLGVHSRVQAASLAVRHGLHLGAGSAQTKYQRTLEGGGASRTSALSP